MAFRAPAVRSVPRTLTSFNAVPYRFSIGNNVFKANLSSLSKPTRSPRAFALSVYQPTPKALTRYAHTKIMSVKEAREHEAVLAKERLPAYPALVSTESSMHPINSEIDTEEPEKDVDMMAGIRSDFVRCAFEKVNGMLLTGIFAGNNQGDFYTAGSAKRGIGRWFSWCHPISCNFAIYCLPVVRYSVRRSPRSRLSDVRGDCRTIAAYH